MSICLWFIFQCYKVTPSLSTTVRKQFQDGLFTALVCLSVRLWFIFQCDKVTPSLSTTVRKQFSGWPVYSFSLSVCLSICLWFIFQCYKVTPSLSTTVRKQFQDGLFTALVCLSVCPSVCDLYFSVIKWHPVWVPQSVSSFRMACLQL